MTIRHLQVIALKVASEIPRDSNNLDFRSVSRKHAEFRAGVRTTRPWRHQRYSRYIIAWKPCTTMKAEDVTATIEMALDMLGDRRGRAIAMGYKPNDTTFASAPWIRPVRLGLPTHGTASERTWKVAPF
jgi:hypothetical protein